MTKANTTRQSPAKQSPAKQSPANRTPSERTSLHDLPPDQVVAGIRHIRRVDARLAGAVDRVGEFRLKLHRNRFGSVARAIVAQQISGAAARTIWNRLEQLVAPHKLSPDSLVNKSHDELRSIGLSRQKADYLRDLVAKTASGEVRFARMGRRSDEEIVAELTSVKGIGVWTAQMFLIFSLGRLDVFAPVDLGLRSAIRNIYGLSELPSKRTSLEIAECWKPFSTIASWYLWRSLDSPLADESVDG